MHAVSSGSPKAMPVRNLAADEFGEVRRELDAGLAGSEAFENILRTLCGGLSRARPAVVIQTLRNLAVTKGVVSLGT